MDSSVTSSVDETTNSGITSSDIRNLALTCVLIFFIAATLILNIIFLVFYSLTRKLRTPHNYVLVSIAVADILSALLWLLPAATSTVYWRWLLGNDFCKAQGFLGTQFYSVNILSLLAIIMEKMMKFWSPSRHELAFTKTVCLILVSSLWGFSLVFAMIPLIGWGNYDYIEPRFHCEVNFGSSYSLLQFYTIAAYCIPLFLGIVFFLMICSKLTAVKRTATPTGETIMEDRGDRMGETYGERLKREEAKYKNVSNNSRKPKLGKNSRDYENRTDGDDDNNNENVNRNDVDSDTDDSDWVESDNEDNFLDYSDVIRKRREDERRKYQKRRFRLHNRDVKMAITVFLVWLIYMVLWMPYVILSYVWIYKYYPEFNDRTTHIIIMIIAFASVCYKPLIYMSNGYMRKVVRAALKKRRLRREKQKHLKELDAEYERNKKKREKEKKTEEE